MAKKKRKHTAVKHDAKNHVYEFKEFRKHGVLAAFSGRRYKMNFKEETPASVVVAARKNFCTVLGISFDQLVLLEQVHGGNIVRVRAKDAGRGNRSLDGAITGTDAVITNEKGIVLSIRTADCAPVFFMDPVKNAIGMAHVGWRGALVGLTGKMIQAFRVQFLSKSQNMRIALGPMIRSCCYEVGEEFRHEFGPFLVKREKKLYFDLAAKILSELKSEGILRSQIFDSGYCTSCENKSFPSYRKEGQSVRHMLSVMTFI